MIQVKAQYGGAGFPPGWAQAATGTAAEAIQKGAAVAYAADGAVQNLRRSLLPAQAVGIALGNAGAGQAVRVNLFPLINAVWG